MFADVILKEIKTNLVDLIKDIETLSSIDYPKMLSMDVFSLLPRYSPMNPCMRVARTLNKPSSKTCLVNFDSASKEKPLTMTHSIPKAKTATQR